MQATLNLIGTSILEKYVWSFERLKYNLKSADFQKCKFSSKTIKLELQIWIQKEIVISEKWIQTQIQLCQILLAY